jgi:signal transduction histidine kinase
MSWIWGEVVLVALLSGGMALFATAPFLPTVYALPAVREVLDTAVLFTSAAVSVLAALRFLVERLRLDLLLACGFFVAAATTLLFAIVPVLGGQPLQRTEAWAGIGGRLLAAALIAAAPFVRGRVASGRRALAFAIALALGLAALWGGSRWLGMSLPTLVPGQTAQQPYLLTAGLAIQAMLSLLALVGFGSRFRERGEDLDRWLALAATLALFAELREVFTPLVTSQYVSQADFLRLLSYCVLLAGVWRAIRASEFGLAVAEERARVAREIHDGLAQYLFAVSTQTSLLESGAPLEQVLPRLKHAAAAAQQEARFAVLALSSASGNAPFDDALRRYVEFLTADGELEVDLEIDEAVQLGPDEQIEIFRIVQEGLANVRSHSRAQRAEVTIGQREGRRLVSISDDGEGFNGADVSPAGQGLKNIRSRSAAIGGAFRLSSRPGRGTALEVTLRV